MTPERKYLDEFEMGLLEKYGIRILKKKYDIADLLSMLPKQWQEEDYEFGHKTVQTYGLNIEWDGIYWTCTTPIWYTEGACTKTANNRSRGDSVLECFFGAVLRLAKDPMGRRYLSKTYVIEDWRYKAEKN
jgi:hypothetical protein